MLYSIDNLEQPITRIPHRADYNRWRANLSDEHHAEILEELNRRIDGSEVRTAGWLPAGTWEDTVFIHIYTACREDYEDAGLFFGLLVWEAFMNRPEAWSFGKYSINNVPIRSMTYFRITI